jgi:DNA polymerase III subunit epsilon
MLQDNLTSAQHEALLKRYPQGVVALDLETTGLSPLVDRMIEISLIKWSPAKIQIFTSFIDPEIIIPESSTAIHGITNEMIQGAPKLETILKQYREFVADLPLIAHNAKFDLGFLIFNLHRHQMSFGENEVYCSCQGAKEAFPALTNYKLSTITQELSIKLESHHRAQDDAQACFEVMARALEVKPDIKPVFKAQDFAKRRFQDLPSALEGLTKKVRQGHVVEIRYKGGTHKNQWRPIQCLSLLPLPQGNVLYAKCLLSQHYKSFLLHRVEQWREVTPEQSAQFLKTKETKDVQE